MIAPNDLTRPDLVLLTARAALRKAMRLHIASVRIGQLSPVLDSGVGEPDLVEAQRIIEEMDLACAEIDKALAPPQPRTTA